MKFRQIASKAGKSNWRPENGWRCRNAAPTGEKWVPIIRGRGRQGRRWGESIEIGANCLGLSPDLDMFCFVMWVFFLSWILTRMYKIVNSHKLTAAAADCEVWTHHSNSMRSSWTTLAVTLAIFVLPFFSSKFFVFSLSPSLSLSPLSPLIHEQGYKMHLARVFEKALRTDGQTLL